MIAAVYVLYTLTCLFLILVVLLQAGKGDGMGAAFGGGGSNTILGNRGAATFLSKLTVASAVLFMLLSIVLAYHSSSPGSRVGRGRIDPNQTPAALGGMNGEETTAPDEETTAPDEETTAPDETPEPTLEIVQSEGSGQPAPNEGTGQPAPGEGTGTAAPTEETAVEEPDTTDLDEVATAEGTGDAPEATEPVAEEAPAEEAPAEEAPAEEAPAEGSGAGEGTGN